MSEKKTRDTLDERMGVKKKTEDLRTNYVACPSVAASGATGHGGPVRPL